MKWNVPNRAHDLSKRWINVRTAGRFGKVVSVVLIWIILLEVGLRISSLFPGDTPFYISDPFLGFRIRPYVSVGENKTNSFGFNDIERKKGRSTKDDFRVVFIGDSFVFGAVPRSRNFVSLTEDLARKAGAEVEAWNMGIPAAGPENYLRLLKEDAATANADVVCVVFFIGNDITQSHPDFKIRVWFGAPREILRSPYLVRFSLEYSYVYRLFRAGTRLFWHHLDERSGAVDETFVNETYLAIEYQRSDIYKIKQSIKEAESYHGAGAIIEKMAIRAAENNQAFLVVLAPDEMQVDRKLRKELMRTYKLNSKEYDFRQPQRLLLQYLSFRGIEALDLLPEFVEAGMTKSLYLKYDSHWNESGNELAAQKIWSRLEEMAARNH